MPQRNRINGELLQYLASRTPAPQRSATFNAQPPLTAVQQLARKQAAGKIPKPQTPGEILGQLGDIGYGAMRTIGANPFGGDTPDAYETVKDPGQPYRTEERKWAQIPDPLSKLKTAPFYSSLRKAIEKDMPNIAFGPQIGHILRNPQNQVRAEEIAWSGLDDWIKAQPGKVKKDDVLEYLKGHELELKEVVKGDKGAWRVTDDGMGADPADDAWFSTQQEADDWITQNIGDESQRNEFTTTFESDGGKDATKFSQYVLPGGENYREMLLQMPEKPEAYKRLQELERRIDSLTPTEELERQSILNGSYGPSNNFTGGHYSEPNVLAHVRFNDRTGPNGEKILHIEEIQSDWHQKGRKQGYVQPPLNAEEKERLVQLRGNIFGRDGATPEQRAEFQALVRRNEPTSREIPDAPFKKSWHELGMKRILRDAVEKGYDRVTWTTGAQQADRYDLSKHFQRLEYNPGTNVLTGYNRTGEPVLTHAATPDDLPDAVGKDVAATLIEHGSAEGEKLSVGGEGMKGFYDKMLRDFANSYTKKWGGKVEPFTLSERRVRVQNGDVVGDTMSHTVHSLKITPKMRESILQRGQPLFSVVPPVIAGAALSRDDETKP